MTTARFDAAALELAGLPKDQVRAIEANFGTVSTLSVTVAGLPAQVISGSPPNTYVRISNDLGGTWLTTSPQTLTVTFTDDLTGLAVATQAIIGTWDDITGFITMSLGAHTGGAVTVAYTGQGTQVAGARVTHTGPPVKVATVGFLSQYDTTALGGFSGGPSK